MSVEDAKKFLSEAQANKQIQGAVNMAAAHGLLEIAHSKGYEFTEEEFKQARSESPQPASICWWNLCSKN